MASRVYRTLWASTLEGGRPKSVHSLWGCVLDGAFSGSGCTNRDSGSSLQHRPGLWGITGHSAQSKRLSDCCQDTKARGARSTELADEAIFRYRLRAVCSLASSSSFRRKEAHRFLCAPARHCHPHTSGMMAKVNLTGHWALDSHCTLTAQEARGAHIFPNSPTECSRNLDISQSPSPCFSSSLDLMVHHKQDFLHPLFP